MRELKTCDACKRDLTLNGCEQDGFQGAGEREFGLFLHRFGYGSRLDRTDSLANYAVCEDCWEKALRSVGLDPNPDPTPPTQEQIKALKQLVDGLGENDAPV